MESQNPVEAIATFAAWLRERETAALAHWKRASEPHRRLIFEAEAAELHAVREAFTARFGALLPPEELEAMRFRPYPKRFVPSTGLDI